MFLGLHATRLREEERQEPEASLPDRPLSFILRSLAWGMTMVPNVSGVARSVTLARLWPRTMTAER
jgi:hypothetical protein